MAREQLPVPPCSPSPARLRLRVLGSFELSVGGVACELPELAQKVVALLALRQGVQRRERIAEQVWPDADHSHGLGNLRTVLWRVRRACPEALQLSRGTAGLGASVSVDLREGQAIARAVLDGEAVDPQRALTLLSRPLLPDWHDEWVLLEQQRVQQLHAQCLEILSCRMLAEGRTPDAMQAAVAACRLEPLRESARQAVVNVLLAEGNRARARQLQKEFAHHLRVEFGFGDDVRLPDREQLAR